MPEGDVFEVIQDVFGSPFIGGIGPTQPAAEPVDVFIRIGFNQFPLLVQAMVEIVSNGVVGPESRQAAVGWLQAMQNPVDRPWSDAPSSMGITPSDGNRPDG